MKDMHIIFGNLPTIHISLGQLNKGYRFWLAICPKKYVYAKSKEIQLRWRNRKWRYALKWELTQAQNEKSGIPQQRQIRILTEGHQVQILRNRLQEAALKQNKNASTL